MSGPGNKRAAGDGGSGPPEKKLSREEKTTTTLIEPIRLGGISSTEEMDLKVLQFKNKKLAERLEQRQAFEDELRERIEKLEKRQATDDATLLIVNRYWAQLDETVEALLRRHESQGELSSGAEAPGTQEGMTHETPHTEPGTSELRESLPMHLRPPLSEPALAFVVALGASSCEEVELQLQGRMEFSKAAVSRVVEASDRLQRQVEELCQRVYSQGDSEPPSEVVQARTRELGRENRRLQDLATQLQEKHHRISLEYSELQDKVTSAETKVLEMETTVEDLQWDIEKLRKREQKLNKHLAEALEQLNSGYYVSGSSSGFQGGQITLSMQKFEMLNAELEENQELANSRMAELEKLQAELQGAVRTNERLKVALRSLPEEVVRETGEYRMLQAQFSLLYNESLQVKTQLDEARGLLLATKNSHLRHIEHMESDELGLQKKLRTEVIQLEDTLAQVRKEYEMLRIEFEQNLAANEQAGPINREMRHLISSLQNHNHQLKGDAQRYKRKLREVQAEIGKLRAQASGSTHSIPNLGHLEDSGLSAPTPGKEEAGPGPGGAPDGRKEITPVPSATITASSVRKEELVSPEEDTQALTPGTQGPSSRGREPEGRPKRELRERDGPGLGPPSAALALSRVDREKARVEEAKRKESELLKGLRAELKKAQESQKEMKLLLDMYKSAPKEQRDKVQLMAAERKAKAEVDELRSRIRELEERDRRESKKIADEDALRRIRQAEEQIEHLQRKLGATKQEEEALLSEMDVTGQAFEDMQEQNGRLLQQLREKDDANFKLMSERIKANQIHKLLREEKDELGEQVLGLKSQVDAQLLTVQKLEEKERALQGSLGGVEKELTIRSQALELNKRKAVEAAQLAEDLKVQLEHVQTRLREIQPCLAESRAAREKESFNLKRAQEDISRLRRKLEKQRKVEVYADADEILQEEIKEYKARLTCPCCNTRKKDAVLTKCFHVFCFECVRGRYEARQRKCPKCNAAFGAHDFHRVYIS
ncbi:PREDICTED: E3 ubiquitin-protein ligase BRE1B isoform X2 [Elephantulus edwardii]|uniref:E3 ubiquitin-protein ligase BRE1B isoform X1 n=1 Tax=Elephantulus edwardii TaxID=28737 RepID=UPI0003F08430|nr:PREDICTED: E3 ubiquitin-protein ligase BRE1B isoform X1 [Elephantulus edwardii]XP_006896578.1 PREDICTED: E3 ubiquitin-protein ligase BRE1B isoform X2 [Elephantulus edwardii]